MDERELYNQTGFEVVTNPQNELKENSLKNQMCAMGKAMVRAKKVMTLEERKLLMMALTKIKWNKAENPLDVELSKLEIEEIMGWKADPEQRSKKIRKLAMQLLKHSYVQMDIGDKDDCDDGFLLTRYRSTKGTSTLTFAPQFMPLLENLTKDKDFVTIWANDIYKFDSIYAYLLFEELRLHSDDRCTNWRVYSTKQLKDLFGIPKDGKGSYMHLNTEKKMVFDRSNFEKKVLDVAIAEINKGQMLRIYPIMGTEECKKLKCYQKIKKNGYITGYNFKYVVRTRQVEQEQLEGQMSLIDDFPQYCPDKKD